MFVEYPEFQLRLPNGGPTARGRLLEEYGTNGSQRFLVLAGSPARSDVVPSFPVQVSSSHRLREQLISDGVIVESVTWTGWLQTTKDVTCNSPSAAAEILVGRSANGYVEWKSPEGHPLADYVGGVGRGARRTWLIRGSNVSGVDLVQRLWLSEGRVSLAATGLRSGVEEGMSKDTLRRLVEEDYESTATYTQKIRLVEEFHTFLSRMRPGDTVCTISGGRLHVGEVTGATEQMASNGGRSNLRRPVEWQDIVYAFDDLPEELQQRLSIQQDVVDLTSVQALVDGLGLSDEELVEEAEAKGESGEEIPALAARRELALPEPDDALTTELLVHDRAWLRELRICCGTNGSSCSTGRLAPARRTWRSNWPSFSGVGLSRSNSCSSTLRTRTRTSSRGSGHRRIRRPATSPSG